MAGMGTTIGAANVKIMPDTRGFKDDVKKTLRELERTLELNIKLTLKDGGLIQEARRAAEKAEKAAGDIKLDVDVDRARLTELANRVRASTREAARMDLEPVANPAEFTRELDRAINAAEKAVGDLKVEMDADAKGLKQKVRAAVANASKAADKIKAKIDLDHSHLVGAARRAAKLASTGLVVEARLKLQRGAAAGLRASARAVFDAFGGQSFAQLRELPRVMGSIAVAGVAVAGVAPSIAAIGTAAASALGPMLKLAGAIAPAAIGSVAVSIGVLKAAFSGLGDAISADTPEDFAAAIADLPPAAQEAAGALRGLKEEFSAMGEVIQQDFWANFSNIGDLSAIMTPLREAMSGLAMDMGNAAAGVVAFVSQGVGLEMISQLFDSSSSAASNLVSALAGAVPGIIALGAAGGPIFEGLTEKINHAADAWSQRMVAAFQDGSLQAALQSMIDKLAEFWGVLQDVGGIISGVWSAMSAAGMPLLGVLGELVGKTNEWVNSAEGMGVLQSFFEGIQRAVVAVSPIMGEIARIIGETLIPAIAEFVEGAAPGFQTFIEKMGEAFELIAPHMGEIGEGFGRILEALAPVLPILAQLALDVLPALVPLLESFAKGLEVLLGFLEPIWPVLVAVGLAIFAWLNPIGAVIAAVGLLIAAIGLLATKAGEVKDWVIEHWNALKDATVAKFEEIKGTALAVWEFIKMGVSQKVTELVTTVIAKITSWVTQIGTWFTTMKTTVTSIATQAWEAVKNAFQNGVNAAINFVRELPGRAASALSNAGSALVASGRALIQGFINGIKSMIGAVADAARSAVQAARDFFPFSPAKRGPFSGRGWVLYSGRSVGSAFAAGIADTAADAAAASGRMATAVHRNLDRYRADVSATADYPTVGGAVAPAGAGITVGTIIAADPERPIRELEMLDFKARIRRGEK